MGAMQGSLCDKFRIQAGTLAHRRRFVRIDEATCARMQSLIEWADEVADALVHEFYDHQFGFEPTLRFFTDLAEARGVALATSGPTWSGPRRATSAASSPGPATATT